MEGVECKTTSGFWDYVLHNIGGDGW
ncbi:hypothetical protein Gogos_000874 [Gossypium gossypioides]|uniref:Uncharacterized protein n=1 Tax=Gossypium gossypioides TaxID=34282 RepID=A0A7J9CU44_GOSGO|nr:hypothetical protein [Gossypium gossypioides]